MRGLVYCVYCPFEKTGRAILFYLEVLYDKHLYEFAKPVFYF